MSTERESLMGSRPGIQALLIAAAILAAGCAESKITSPPETGFDVTGSGRANAAMNALVSGPALLGVAALDGRMPSELGVAGPVSASSRSAGAGLPGLALRMLQSLPGTGGPLTVPVIRPAVLGHTYVYDPAVHRYVPDLSRTGAPENGVRFILYAVAPGSNEPLVGQETGYADLTDLLAGTLGVGLRFRAVSSGRTFLDYAFTLTPTFTGGILGVSGFLADEQHRLDFTIGAVGHALGATQTARVTFEFDLPSERFHATGSLDAAASGSAGTARVDIAVTIGSDAVRLTGETTGDAVNARLTVNGRLFAAITGDPDHPTVLGDGGRELTLAEIQVLGGLVGVVYGAIEMLEHLLVPIAALLGITVSL